MDDLARAVESVLNHNASQRDISLRTLHTLGGSAHPSSIHAEQTAGPERISAILQSIESLSQRVLLIENLQRHITSYSPFVYPSNSPQLADPYRARQLEEQLARAENRLIEVTNSSEAIIRELSDRLSIPLPSAAGDAAERRTVSFQVPHSQPAADHPDWLSDHRTHPARSSASSQTMDGPSTSSSHGSSSASSAPLEFPKGYDRFKRRFSVSTESYNPQTMKETTLKFYEKSPQAKHQIRSTIADNILFKHLEEEQLATLEDAMFEVTASPDEFVITQGDAGDNFYVIASGELAVLVAKNNKPPVKVATLGPGRSFGEIALMYNCPRMASVKAITPCKLWAMDRTTFRAILMDASIKRRQLYESFLKQVPILSSLLPYERSIIADALESKTYKEGDVILRQGDIGDTFFIVERGEVVVTQTKDKSQPAVEMLRIGPGGYFGEIALLTNNPRAATVTASSTEVKCLSLRRQDFTQLMGPVEDILRRNINNYTSYEEEIRKQNAMAKKERGALVAEFAASEQDYVRALTRIVRGFQLPLRKACQSKETIIDPEQISRVFSNAELLLNIHNEVISQFAERSIGASDKAMAGQVLNDLAPALKLYETFVGNYYTSRLELSALNEISSVKELLEKLALNAEYGNDEPLHKLLERPVERVNFYLLMIESLVAHTPENHPDYHYLQQALEKLRGIATRLDSIKSQTKAVYDAVKYVRGSRQELIEPSRQLLMSGTMHDDNDNQLVCHLFNDILLVCMKGSGEMVDFKTSLYLRDTNVEEGPKSFTLSDESSRVVFVPDDAESKAQWCAAISRAVGRALEE